MKKLYINKEKQKGFTLIELIIVLSIIGILLSAVVPKMTGQTMAAKKKADKITARTIGLAYETEIANGIEFKDIDSEEIKNTYFNGSMPTPKSTSSSFIVGIDNNSKSVIVSVAGETLYP